MSVFKSTASEKRLLAFQSNVRSVMAEIFALIGDSFHNPDYIRTALDKIIKTMMGKEIVYTNDVSQLSASAINRYAMLIILRDGFQWPNGYPDDFDGIPVTRYPGYIMEKDTPDISDPAIPCYDKAPQPWITSEQGRALKHYVSEGGAILFLHNSSHIALTNDDTREVLGGAFIGHPPVRPFKVKITNPNHPVTAGAHDFIITDEQHFVHFGKNPDEILMRSENIDGKTFIAADGRDYGAEAIAGWAHHYGEGKVCFMAPGHRIDVFWNPEYCKLIQNTIHWMMPDTE